MFVGIDNHAVPGLCGLVTAPSSVALRYGGPSLSCPSLTSPCVFQSFFVMSSSDQDFWLRELARTGLSAFGQKELLTSFTKAVADREKYFPPAPLPYLCRARQILMAAFLPRKGPLFVAMHPESEQELLSRSQCWQLVHLEFSLLDVKHRSVEGVHEAITEIIELLTSSDFPLTIPPRWLVELFSDLEWMTSRRMEKNGWSLRSPGVLDLDSQGLAIWRYSMRSCASLLRCGHGCQAYFDAVMRNMENDKRRSRRQLAAFSSGDTEVLVDSSEQSLLSPDADAVVPPLPPGFPWDHRPRLWSALPG